MGLMMLMGEMMLAHLKKQNQENRLCVTLYIMRQIYADKII